VHQVGVLEGNTQAAREGRQQALVGLVERVLAVEVVERDHARRAPARDERDEENGLRHLAGDHDAAPALGFGDDVFVEHERLARLEYLHREAAAQEHRLGPEALTAFDQVWEAHDAARLVQNRDRCALRVEDLLDLVADHVVDRLHLELSRERLLHAVDQRELGVPLPRLVHELCVVERDSEASGDGREQPLIRLVECVLTVEAVDRDDAGRPPTHDERLEDGRAVGGGLAGDRRRVAVLDARRFHALEDGQRLTRLHHVLPEADDRQRHVREVDAALDLVDEAQNAGVLVEHGDVDGLRVEDLSELLADGVVDRLLVELAGDRLLHAVDQRQLRVPLPRLLDRASARERGAHVLPDEGEQVPVLLRVADVARIGLHHEHTDRPLLGLERSAQPVAVLGEVVTGLDLA
jgi:hypothetical protein